jgi:hypothetical protein
LKNSNGLYAGGNNGFVPDVIGSNLTTFFYKEDNIFLKFVPQLSIGIALLFGILSIYQIFNWIMNRNFKQSEILFFLLAICVLIPIIQFQVLKVFFPTERGVIFYYPLCILAGFSTLDLLEKKSIHYVVGILLSFFVFYNFSKNANITHCYTWAYEQNTKAFLTTMKSLHDAKQLPDKVTLGVHWKYQPAIEYYYRQHWHLDWLLPVERESVGKKASDIYYIEANELPLVAKLDTFTSIFKSFPNNKSLILTRNVRKK